MTYQCDPCVCPDQHYRANDTFKKAVLTLLCGIKTGLLDILNAVSGSVPPTTAATFSVLASRAYNLIVVGYSTVVDLPNNTRNVILDNQTNGDVYISMDGGATDTYHLKGGDKLVLDLYALGVTTTAIVQVRYGIGGASSSGTFFVYSIQ